MRLFFACLVSLGIHLVLLCAPAWPSFVRATRTPLQVTLQKQAAATSTMTDLATRTAPDSRPQPPHQAAPQKLSGKSLHRAQAVLSKHLFYPQSAVAQGLQGDVVLLLALDSKGGIQAIEIAKSSGHALLDQAAIDAARHIGALPGNPHQTLLPVSFRLQ